MAKRALLLLLLSLAATRAGAGNGPEEQEQEIIPGRSFPSATRQAAKEEETPAAIRWMIGPLKRGMFIRLPVVDTDPNRGITVGIMPIVVLQGKNDDRIKQIHAPSLTYNKDFKLSPTYRYYYYPQEDAALMVRASRSKYEHEAMIQYEDGSIGGTVYDVLFRVQKNTDAGQRFFGLGPDTPKSAEANYKQDYWQYQWSFGAPFTDDSPWRARVSQRYEASRILDGPLPGLPGFSRLFPDQFSDGSQQTNETRLSLTYDTRDHTVTTVRGAYLGAFAEGAVRGFASQYDYERYGVDGRWFKPWPSDGGKVLALQARYEQLLGRTPPFWILPQLGGKYSLRAYGDGRYADRGLATINVEQRIKLLERKTAGVTTEFQVAPFAGLGTVFDNPGRAAAKYVRPVVGGAVRAVARPQVVGSVDFGVGREGLSVFMDINYSF